MTGRDHVAEALAELREQRARIAEAREALGEQETVATSKDRSISVTVDGRGQVTAIEFGSTKFRRMAPAELGSVLVDTIRAAREAARETVAETYQPLFPASVALRSMMRGSLDLDELFAEAVRVSRQPMPGEAPTRPYPGHGGRGGGNG